VTSVRTAAGIGVGAALLSMLTGCSSDTRGGAIGVSAPITEGAGSTPRRTTAAPAEVLFSRRKPVSVVTWWKDHPAAAPANLAKHTLLLNREGKGPQRFPGPDMRRYNRVLMIITCASKAQYVVRLQVLDGLSIASTSGASCGGPDLSAYSSPFVKVTDRKTEVEVEVPAGTRYYVTVYGNHV
jgi:hypothetical protein